MIFKEVLRDIKPSQLFVVLTKTPARPPPDASAEEFYSYHAAVTSYIEGLEAANTVDKRATLWDVQLENVQLLPVTQVRS